MQEVHIGHSWANVSWIGDRWVCYAWFAGYDLVNYFSDAFCQVIRSTLLFRYQQPSVWKAGRGISKDRSNANEGKDYIYKLHVDIYDDLSVFGPIQLAF